jgi:hypothetical protein
VLPRASLAIVAVLVAACSSTPANSAPSVTDATPPVAETTQPTLAAAPPIELAGSDKTGVSAKFKLAAGSYKVAWTTTASQASCAFYLFLTTKKDGPTIKDIEISILPVKRTYDGTAEWAGVKAGTYVMQEDRSGLLNCTGPWSATLTPK